MTTNKINPLDDEVLEPENSIKSIAEILQVLKKEGVKQPTIYLSKTIKGIERDVVLLGETHIATKKEERAYSRILPFFKCLGCEGIDVEEFIEGKFFFWAMHYIHYIMGIFFYIDGRSKKNKSSLDKAAEYYNSELETKHVLSLEKGWKPSIRTRILFIAFPVLIIHSMLQIATESIDVANDQGGLWAIANIVGFIVFVVLLKKMPIIKEVSRFLFNFIIGYVFDLGPSRNRNMAKNLVTELNENKIIDNVLVLTGSIHTKPIAKILKKKYGFTEKDF
ncbi:MAG: hypothetical protein KAU07_01460 [Candidatus Andersenbacteria bacterium]|nr:hypothetical protein [Candidatus Andersenbacteria bacterium]